MLSISTVFIVGLTAALGQTGADTASVPGPNVDVREVLGVPTFVVGDEPFVTPCFETYVPSQEYFNQFAEAGVRLFSFNTNVAACDYGHSNPTWLGPGEWDYSGFDERFERVLKAKPDAWVIPRVNLGTPRWWLDEHPEEMEILASGSALYMAPNRNPTLPQGRAFPSLGSEKWREDMGMALERFLDHVQNSKYADHIFGYILAGLDTEEWYHWSSGSNQLAGYSPHTQRAFRDWLREKYQTGEALRKAWRDDGVTFETAAVPSRDRRFDLGETTFRNPDEKMDVIDFYLFYNEIVPETIDYFARIVREKTAGSKVIGAFYGFMYEFRGDPEYGHNALARYNASPNLDFMFVTASYGHRGAGTGGDYSRSSAYSVRLHDKLWYHDNDVVSYLAPEILKRVGVTDEDGRLAHYLDVLGYTDTAESTRWMYRRSMGFALCNGAYESYFDLHGGYYDSPELMDEVKTLNRVAEVAKRYYRRSNSEILVVADEVSCSYASFRSDMLASTLADTQPLFIKIGAPADHVLLSDLELLDTDQYKLVVFLNCYRVTAAQREIIRTKLMKGGKHLAWCYAPGYFGEDGVEPDGMSTLAGMSIVPAADPDFVAPRIKLVDDTYGQAGAVIGPDQKMCRLHYVDDLQATVLGTLPGTDRCTLARKEQGDWTSLYLGTAAVPSAVWRAMARAAGVHIYNDRDDTLYANETFLSIHADGAGERTIRFPWACDVVDMITEKPVAVNTDTYTYHFQDGETLILRWKTRL